MTRSLIVLFRRDPTRDRQRERIRYEGYQPFWPDGRPVAVGLDAFCMHGQRLLGLGKHLAGQPERLIKMVCKPLQCRDEDMTRMPGHRVRRFLLKRTGEGGQLFFLDGTPTTVFFEMNRDEDCVLDWIGLTHLEDGEEMWFDLAAAPVEYNSDELLAHTPRLATAEV